MPNNLDGGAAAGRPLASPAPVPAPRRQPRDDADVADDEADEDVLTLVLNKDFMEQLTDRFGHSSILDERPAESTIVRVPVSFARQMHYLVLLTRQQDLEEEAEAERRRCEEDERVARRLYEDMCRDRAQRDRNQEQREHRVAAGGSQGPSPEAEGRRQLEDKFPQIEREIIHFKYATHDFSVEATAKELEALLQRDQDFFAMQVDRAGRAAQPSRPTAPAATASFLEALQVKEPPDDDLDENPWDAADSMAVFNKYREKAEQWRQRRDHFYRSASDAFRASRHTQAGFYTEQGQQCDKQFQRCSALASAALIAAHSDRSADTLDLHHFKVDEAVTVLDLFLDFHIRRLAGGEHGNLGGEERLTIVTGRGLNSKGGRPRIKPAVLSRAHQRKLRVIEFRENPGLVRLFITKDSLPAHRVAPWGRNASGAGTSQPWTAWTGLERADRTT